MLVKSGSNVLGMLLHRVGQRRAAFDVGARGQDRLREVLVFLLGAQNLEALHERQARVDHDGELPHEDRQVLRIDLLAEFALLRHGRGGCARFLLRRRDAGDENLLAAERRDGGVRVVCDALAGDVFSTACAARIGKCRHNSSLFAERAEGREQRAFSALCPLTSALPFHDSTRHGRPLRHARARSESGALHDARAARDHLIELFLQRRSRPSPPRA